MRQDFRVPSRGHQKVCAPHQSHIYEVQVEKYLKIPISRFVFFPPLGKWSLNWVEISWNFAQKNVKISAFSTEEVSLVREEIALELRIMPWTAIWKEWEESQFIFCPRKEIITLKYLQKQMTEAWHYEVDSSGPHAAGNRSGMSVSTIISFLTAFQMKMLPPHPKCNHCMQLPLSSIWIKEGHVSYHRSRDLCQQIKCQGFNSQSKIGLLSSIQPITWAVNPRYFNPPPQQCLKCTASFKQIFLKNPPSSFKQQEIKKEPESSKQVFSYIPSM